MTGATERALALRVGQNVGQDAVERAWHAGEIERVDE